MTIFVDTPMWPWQGRLWGHLISDESIEELHAFARVAGLRYLSFGFDHYDVPDVLFAHVQDLGAEVVDGREIVRKLRRSGLRTTKGKSAKRFTRVPGGVRTLLDGGLGTSVVSRSETAVVAAPDSAEAVERPGETVLVVTGPRQPSSIELSELQRLAGKDRRVISSPGPWGWAIEVVASELP